MCRCRRGQMHIVETLFLNPFEKWVLYGRFPCKFVVHLILSIVVTGQAVIYFQRDIEHVSRTNQHFVHMFTSTDPLHSPYALQLAVADLISNHFLINNRSIVRYQLQHPEELVMTLIYRDAERGQFSVESKHWLDSFAQQKHMEYLEEIFPLLFDVDDLQTLREIKAIQRMDELGNHCNKNSKDKNCLTCVYHWELLTVFDGHAAGDFVTRLDAKARDCQGKEWHLMHFMSVCVAFFAVLSLLLVARKVCRSIKVIRQFRSSSQTWARLSYRDVASMMSIWWAVTVLSNLLQLVAAAFCLSSQPEIGLRFTWVGFSSFCTWMNMIQYFESFPSYFIAFHTISRGGVRILQLFFSVAPFFFAFILLGVCLFWKSAMFQNPESAAEMLFSLMNGDSIHDAFKEVRSVGGILLQAYLYVFIFLAIYVILNINIGIVEDAFHEAKGRYVHSHPSPEQELSESISERVRRAIEEESPELDTLELLHGRHVGAEHRSTEMTSSSFGSPEQNGSPLPSDRGRLTKSMSGKYISPRILESPNLQEALVSTFSDRARSVSLPAQHLEVSVPGPALVRPPRPITKAVTGSLDSSSSESRGGLDLNQDTLQEEPVSGPEMEMRTVDPEVAMALQELHLAAGRLQSRLANPSGPLLASLEHLEEAINEASRLAQG
ncbi:Mucolipin-3 (Transient receptor potential channel mucolipin 3) (TRPML3) [Durusdinium trenchii]|uniref:Mucolipin-3 (Transient receptor potential channel mucolipin 3) (TRPML3) n=1 Tax=Durusdinium trenchii TaxID=1381693 RepID=A0ABP0L6W9_9DINO